MGFFLQLKILVWKNFLVRKRNKSRLVLEVIWPLFLFLILMWVRTRGLKEVREECHYLEKALPSAGQFAFFHSLICNAPNACHRKNGSVVPPMTTTVQSPKLTDLTNEFGRLLLNDGKLPRLIKNYGDFGVIMNSVERNTTLEGFPIKLRDILTPARLGDVPPDWLDRQINTKKLDKAMLTDSPREFFCLKSKVGTASEELCDEITAFVWEDIDTSADSYRRSDLEAFIRPSAWLRFQTAIQSMAADLDGINFEDIDSKAQDMLNWIRGERDPEKAPADGWCDLIQYINQTRIPENDLTRTMRGEGIQLKSRYSVDPFEPLECKEFLNSSIFKGIPGISAVWKIMKPLIRGKILYTPVTTATTNLMKRVNQTFNDLLSLGGFQDLDTNVYLNNMDQGFFVREQPQTPAGKKLLSVSFRQNALFLTPILFRRSGDISRLREAVRGSFFKASPSDDRADSDDSVGGFMEEALTTLARFLKCLDRDKVQPVSYNKAETTAARLAMFNNLWALVVFDAAGNETLEPFVKYRIRLSAERVDSTLDIMDRRTNYRSRDSPVTDLKYLSYGFAYLQDAIDGAIVEEHTGVPEDRQPGRILKQFPYPSYVYDQFIKAISNTFPMFMVLAWVFTSALVVKSVVYEKEQRIKETLSVMGLGNGVHWAGWFVDSFCIMLVSLTALSLILVYGKVIEKADWTVVWVFLLSFAVATLSLSFLISVFFSRANVAAAAAGIIYFGTYMPYPLVVRFADVIPFSGYVCASLASNIAFGLGASVFAAYEQTGEGVQWYNIDIPANADDLVTMGLCIRMLWLDALIYSVLTWYIEAVFPGMYGIPKPYLFFLSKTYWCGTSVPSETMNGYVVNSDTSIPDVNMEPEPSSGAVGVAIKRLSKSFGDKAAVDNLSLNFYQDQITCFLGHNGAGKTTTISMLTGMYPPTSGTAEIYGMDIRRDMDSIRSSTGVCPQHNVLFDSLTVEEHLQFFGRIKGLDHGALLQEINGMLKDMGLEDKRHALTSDLSGGMKRKLSVGIAFVGGSRTVFLDEPTAGVDPFSRRAIWELLIKYRKGRTVILTTHFMDEADLLGDRIAIISNGRLQCCGSSVFLKTRFGSGYFLTVEWRRQQNQDYQEESDNRARRLRQLVTATVSSAQVVQEVVSESVFVLRDRHDVGAITALLEKMDESSDSLGIESYGISDTSLEEIFLKVAEKNEPTAAKNEGVSLEDPIMTSAPPGSSIRTTTTSLSGTALFKQQYLALSRKRYNYVRRDPKGLFTQLVLPALFVALSLVFTNFFNVKTDAPELVLEPSLYGEPVVGFWQFRDEAINLGAREQHLSSMLADGVGSSLSPLRNAIGDPDLPLLVQRRQSLARSLVSTSPDSTCANSPAQMYVDEAVAKASLPSKELYYNGTGVEIEEWIVDTYANCKRNRYGGVTFGASYPFTENSSIKLHGFNNALDNLRIWYDNKGHASAPAYLNAINNVVLRSLLPEEKRKTSREYGILTSNHPLPLTPEQYKDKTLSESGTVLFQAVAVIFAMSFVPASFIIFLIEDRVAQSKHLQLVSGLRPAIYWVQSYTWDLVSFAVSEVLVVAVFIVFQSEMFVAGTNVIALSLLIFLYGMACIPLLYLLSWVFKISSLAFVVLSCGNLFIGLITTLSVLILGLFEEQELRNIQAVLEVAFLVFPQYCLGQGLMNMATNYLNRQILARQDLGWDKSVLAWAVTGKFLVTLLVITLVLLVAVFLVELKIGWFHRKKSTEARSGSSKEDDVQLECARVESGLADGDFLVLKRLTKSYRQGAPLAVDGVSFGVGAGECFGLLGLNGAGKTSIFKMLTGETSISGGDAFVAGKSARVDMESVRKLIGYCPQFDALIPLLTVREHLDLYCSLRGMPSAQRVAAVDRALQRLNLGFYQDKQAKSLSGGNKRKLSTAIALVGDPLLLYMDEPTTSMDPGARRFLWDCVQRVVASGRSVLLTSHSMEECQALCGKITIMVNGQLQCFGSPQHLNNKYGSGYSVVVRCHAQRTAEARVLVLQRLPGSVVVEAHLNQIKFHVPPSGPGQTDLRLVTIFRTMDQARQVGCVLDYSLSQTTLEDVFMRFAMMQRNEETSSLEAVGCLDWIKKCLSPFWSKEVKPTVVIGKTV